MRRSLALITFTFVAMIGSLAASANGDTPGGTFVDDNGNTHEGGIEAIAAADITLGCNPPSYTEYCPDDTVRRGPMAAFIARALDLPSATQDYFADDNSSTFEGAINRLAQAGITQGCNPPDNTEFCPDEDMTRAQMAAFLARAYDLGASDTDWFGDDDGHVLEGAINRIAGEGITAGCNPPDNDDFCPNDPVRRDQMATFIARAEGLSPINPPPVTTFGPGTHVVGDDIPAGIYRNTGYSDGCYWERVSGFSGGFEDIIANEFDNLNQIVEIYESDAGFHADPECGTWTNQLVSERQGHPSDPLGPGTYRVGEEVAPGTWSSTPVSGDSCYWERVSAFSGEISDVIANEFTDTQTVVEISETDTGFYSGEGCGIWTRTGG